AKKKRKRSADRFSLPMEFRSRSIYVQMGELQKEIGVLWLCAELRKSFLEMSGLLRFQHGSSVRAPQNMSYRVYFMKYTSVQFEDGRPMSALYRCGHLSIPDSSKKRLQNGTEWNLVRSDSKSRPWTS